MYISNLCQPFNIIQQVINSIKIINHLDNYCNHNTLCMYGTKLIYLID